MKEVKCEVIQDLITLYIDELSSDESNELIEKHIKECVECKRFLEGISINNDDILKEQMEITYEEKEETLINKIKKSKYHWALAVTILLATIASLVTQGRFLFNGFLVFPAVGAVGYLLVKKLYIAPLSVYIMNIIVSVLYGIGESMVLYSDRYSFQILIGNAMDRFLGALTMGGIFTLLTLIGCVVGILIKKIFLEE